MKILVIFDRDGTLIVDKNYLSDPAGVELLPGVIDGMQKLAENGAVFALASNQSGIGRGFFSADDATRVNDRLIEILLKNKIELPFVYFCPHAPEEGCNCRRPQPEMLNSALHDSEIDRAKAFMVGDKSDDVHAGKNAGMRSVLLRTGYGASVDASTCEPDFIAENLIAAAEWILNKIKNPG